ncbi:hypothetical protein BDV35DRAFT_179906 [Aspergillus flavus]|uniref:Uncharacterized protein n=1 Tax=Aspergillus flavus TaxID=5059 RepID=A0A5N6H091_ASPFL|nr:hypothetical protein BDV35DRAFT_179906 [Aspergillus flavus]
MAIYWNKLMLTIYIYLSLLFLSTKDIYVCFDTLTFTTDSKLQLQTSTFTVSITYDTVIYQSTSGQNHPVYLAVSRARESVFDCSPASAIGQQPRHSPSNQATLNGGRFEEPSMR